MHCCAWNVSLTVRFQFPVILCSGMCFWIVDRFFPLCYNVTCPARRDCSRGVMMYTSWAYYPGIEEIGP